MKTTALVTEYGGETTRRLSHYYRGSAKGWVKKNASNNRAVNHSAGVPETGPLRMSEFYSQGKGFTYTNTTVRESPVGNNHYYPDNEFGDDFASSPWPMFYVNNAAFGALTTTWVACVITGRSTGPFTFTNNSTIDGAGGAASSGAGNYGQRAIHIAGNASGVNRPIIVNNGTIRGGGGGGGKGGTGGTGGTGYTQAWTYENYNGGAGVDAGDIPGPEAYTWTVQNNGTGNSTVWYADVNKFGVGGVPAGLTSIAHGDGYTYFKGSFVFSGGGSNHYHGVYRGYLVTSTHPGGAGGAGGNGGRGQGYDSVNQVGAAGAAGANGGTNAGKGGTGGAGGSGGAWAAGGITGGTGGTGVTGNYTGGAAGTAGFGGGAAGQAIYADPAGPAQWGLINNGTITGIINAGVDPS
jgi:hypothetical protein